MFKDIPIKDTSSLKKKLNKINTLSQKHTLTLVIAKPSMIIPNLDLAVIVSITRTDWWMKWWVISSSKSIRLNSRKLDRLISSLMESPHVSLIKLIQFVMFLSQAFWSINKFCGKRDDGSFYIEWRKQEGWRQEQSRNVSTFSGKRDECVSEKLEESHDVFNCKTIYAILLILPITVIPGISHYKNLSHFIHPFIYIYMMTDQITPLYHGSFLLYIGFTLMAQWTGYCGIT